MGNVTGLGFGVSFGVMACVAAVMVGLGPADRALGRHIVRYFDRDSLAARPDRPPSLMEAWDGLCEDANAQRAELSALHDWAGSLGRPDHAQRVSELQSEAAEGFIEPTIAISYTVCMRSVQPEAFPDDDEAQLWQAYHELADRQRAYRERIGDLRRAIYADLGIEVRAMKRFNPFDRVSSNE